MFYVALSFSVCSSRRHVSPSDLRLCACFRYNCSFTPTHKTHTPCTSVCVLPIGLGTPEDQFCPLFSSGSPLPAHSLRLAHRDSCLIGQRGWARSEGL